MHSTIQYALGTIILCVGTYTNNIPVSIQGLAIVIWASSINLQESRH